MPKVAPLQSNFSGGEVSSTYYGRVDTDRYKISLKTCLNYLPTVQGPIIRRSGTRFISATKDNGEVVLQAFEFSITQAYIIEFGHLYVRFYKDNEIITIADKVITSITQANPAVVTSVAHGFSNGDRVLITNVSGMTQVNNREFTVAGAAANTFQLSGVDSTGYDAYVSGGVAAEIYEIVSPYSLADLPDLRFTQSVDVLYIVHPDHIPTKLLRFGHTSWEFRPFIFQDGPYLSENFSFDVTSTTTLTPSAFTGSGVTLVSGPTRVITNATNNGAGLIRINSVNYSFETGDRVYITGVTGTTEANGVWIIDRVDNDNFDLRGSAFVNAYIAGGTAFPGLFYSTDVGSLIRVREGSLWGWARVTAFNSPNTVTITIIETFTNVTAKTIWRLGLYSDTRGFPAVLTFHEDRLMFGGSNAAPQRQDGSVTGDYENFTPSDLNGTVNADNALSFSFNSTDVNAIKWMVSDEKGLLSGTQAAEWVTRPSNQSEALAPTNINAKKSTSWGSENVAVVQAGKAALFVQRAGRKIREINYYFDVDGYRASDLTQLADHILPTGVRQMAYQKEPQSIIWVARNDGVLASLIYDRDLDSLRAGWARNILGGYGDAANGIVVVESVQVIPSADSKRQDVWLVVKRYINGGVKRYIEYITPFFEDTVEQRDALFLDSSLTFDAPLTITDITQANPGVVTVIAHGFTTGDKILINDVKGMTQVNGETFLVGTTAANTFELKTLTNTNVDTTSFTAYIMGGEVRKLVTTITGLNHLEGQTVSVLGDGAVQPDEVVTGGKITLTEKAATVHVGYNYNSDGELLRLEAGAADGTALGKARRMHKVRMLLNRTLGLKVGMSFDELDTVVFRTTSDPMTRAPALFTGIIEESLDANYDTENNFCFRQNQPLPGNILAVMPRVVTQDGD